MTWRNLTRPGMAIALAALCAIDFLLKSVTALMEDTASDSFLTFCHVTQAERELDSDCFLCFVNGCDTR
jgi:hypothetical protein